MGDEGDEKSCGETQAAFINDWHSEPFDQIPSTILASSTTFDVILPASVLSHVTSPSLSVNSKSKIYF